MKKGFTLIELLAVMAIVLTITVTTIVGFSTLSKTNQEREYQKQKDKFLTAAKIYAHDNPSFNVYVYSEFNTTGMCVSLQTLVDYNLVSPNIIDPRNSKDYDYGSVVIIKNNSGVLSYELKSKPGVTECKEFTNQAIIYDRIIKDNGVIQTVADDTMFTHAAPADKSENGLWKEARVGKTEGDKPTYFFRGSVQNNYVSFAGKMWRIVRINEDGTVKLILGGNSTEDGYIDSATHVWNPSNNQATYVNYVGSTAKTDIDAWYNTNITGANNDKVVTWNVCNDKSGSTSAYGAKIRLETNKTPQFKCPNASDNIAIKGGILSADEVAYAGGIYDQKSDSYLFDNAKKSGDTGNWWLSSPYNFNPNSNMIYVKGTIEQKNLFNSITSSAYNLRPVISLKKETLVTGKGTKTDPYLVG